MADSANAIKKSEPCGCEPFDPNGTRCPEGERIGEAADEAYARLVIARDEYERARAACWAHIEAAS